MASLVQVFLAGLLLVGIAVAAPQGSFGYTSEAPAYDPPQDPTSSFGGSFQDQSNPAPEEPAFSPVFQDQSAHETSAQVSFSHSAQPHSPSTSVTDHPLSTQGDDSSSFSAHGQTDDHDDTERSFGEDGEASETSPVTEADTLTHPFSSFHNPHSSFN